MARFYRKPNSGQRLTTDYNQPLLPRYLQETAIKREFDISIAPNGTIDDVIKFGLRSITRTFSVFESAYDYKQKLVADNVYHCSRYVSTYNRELAKILQHTDLQSARTQLSKNKQLQALKANYIEFLAKMNVCGHCFKALRKTSAYVWQVTRYVQLQENLTEIDEKALSELREQCSKVWQANRKRKNARITKQAPFGDKIEFADIKSFWRIAELPSGKLGYFLIDAASDLQPIVLERSKVNGKFVNEQFVHAISRARVYPKAQFRTFEFCKCY